MEKHFQVQELKMIEKKLNITNHSQGWGVMIHYHGSIHYFLKDVWKSICGHERLTEISERWKMKFYEKNNRNFPERKKCLRCLKFMKANGITDF